MWLFGIIILALVGLCIRITVINANDGAKYKKQVLSQSQQKYDSRVIPFQRGDIKDRNGVVLATSEKVYKVILDCKVVNSKEDYIEPTIRALEEILEIDGELVREKITNEKTKSSQYQIMKTQVSITKKKEFEAYVDVSSEEAKENLSEKERTERRNVKGVWFEEYYQRTYPLNSTACDVVGFAYSGDVADWGLEGYYSSTLNGINGRQYGYFNEDEDVEQTIIEPVNGDSLVTTLDVNIQQIVENTIQLFMEGMGNASTFEPGAKNVGVIVMNPNNGEVLAMANDSPYDLNNPRDLTPYYKGIELTNMTEEEKQEAMFDMWKNFCISDAFEPGSTVKPLTIGGALTSNSILSSDTFECDGYEMFGNTRIRCAVYPDAHGEQTLGEVLKNSCNDGLMAIAEKMGPEEFLKYQSIFNFGSKTGIDLPGESSGIVHSLEQLSSRSTELASASFGQGYTCTMLQEMAAICSVINGGNYYKPHLVTKIVDENGNVEKNIEPVLLKQTVSSDVSALIREYMGLVPVKGGTGYGAKVDGYSMGGKTGTAQKYPRGNGKYLVSYIGFAPLDNPQVAVYVVVDEPNTSYQADSKYAQYIFKQIMIELLPYMNIFPDEELTGKSSNEMAYFEGVIEEEARIFRAIKNGEMTADGDELEGEGTTEEELFGEEIEDQEGTDDPNVPAPLEGGEDPDYDNKENTDGITNEDAERESGN